MANLKRGLGRIAIVYAALAATAVVAVAAFEAAGNWQLCRTAHVLGALDPIVVPPATPPPTFPTTSGDDEWSAYLKERSAWIEAEKRRKELAAQAAEDKTLLPSFRHRKPGYDRPASLDEWTACFKSSGVVGEPTLVTAGTAATLPIAAALAWLLGVAGLKLARWIVSGFRG